jgi:hypothetical protein
MVNENNNLRIFISFIGFFCVGNNFFITLFERMDTIMSIIIDTLKKKWFELALKENYPNNPDITAQLDELKEMIDNETKKEKK